MSIDKKPGCQAEADFKTTPLARLGSLAAKYECRFNLNIAISLLLGSLLSFSPAFATSTFESHFSVGRSYLLRQDYDRAIREFDRALVLKPGNDRALIERGTAFNELEKFDLAIKDFNNAINGGTKNFLAFNNLGVAYFRMGQYAKAKEFFSKASQIAPKDPYPLINSAMPALVEGEYAKAGEHLEKAIGILTYKEKLATHAATLAALAYRLDGDKAKADKVLLEALSKSNRFNWPYQAAQYLAGKMNSESLLQEAEESNYANTQAHFFIGLHLISMKKDKEAEPFMDWVGKYGTKSSMEYWLARGMKLQKKKASSATNPVSDTKKK